jgi:DNA-binding LytR/AlgR family response regulator
MIKCIAIDDEPLALLVLKEYCKRVPYLNLVKTFTQVSELKIYTRKQAIDLIFCDIQMPDANGIDLYKSIEQKPLVIFTTAHTKYAVQGFEVSAIDYLMKPFKFDRFLNACEKANKVVNKQVFSSESALYVRSNYSLIKVLHKDIIYIETVGDFIKIHQENKEPVSTLMSLKKTEQKLPKNEFIRVHRSFIVARSKITSIRRNFVLIKEEQIPIGSTYKAKIESRY